MTGAVAFLQHEQRIPFTEKIKFKNFVMVLRNKATTLRSLLFKSSFEMVIDYFFNASKYHFYYLVNKKCIFVLHTHTS